MTNETAEQYAGPILGAVRSILSDVESGRMTAASAESRLVAGVAQTIDLVLPTGALDDLDDIVIDLAVRELVNLLKDWVTRDAGEMRRAASRKLAKVGRAKAKGRDMIGLRSVAFVERRAIELLLEADLLDSVQMRGV